MNKMTYMGIDPGLDGGVVVVREGDSSPIVAFRLKPFIEKPKLFASFLAEFAPRAHGLFDGVEVVALEQLPTGHPGERGVNSAKTMGENWGTIYGMLVAFGFTVITPLPSAWQKHVLGAKADRDEADTKKASCARALQLFPGINLRPGKCRTDHDGLADAACLAKYAMDMASEVNK